MLILVLLVFIPLRWWTYRIARKMGVENASYEQLEGFYWPLFRKMAWRAFLVQLLFCAVLALGGSNPTECGQLFFGALGLYPITLLELMFAARLPISKAKEAIRKGIRDRLVPPPLPSAIFEPAGSAPLRNTQTRLENLRILHQAGHISPQEFAASKQRIIDEI